MSEPETGPALVERTERGSTSSQQRQCWICFATEEDDENANWVQPCNCRGTTKWVHQACLQQWVNEKQKEHRSKKVSCPQCKTEYLIFFPHMVNISGRLVILLDKIDGFIYKLCPFVAAGIMVGSMYWTAVTYGAVTVMQVAGQKDAVIVMEKLEPAVLLTGLPAIPVALVVLKMFRWEDTLLQFLRKCSPSIPILNHVLPASVSNESGLSTEMNVTEGMSSTRIFTGALLLPSIATLCGSMFFQSVPSNFHRALLGGLSFVLVKGIVKMYHKQQLYLSLSRRRILDYTPENVASFRNAAHPRQSHQGTSESEELHQAQSQA